MPRDVILHGMRARWLGAITTVASATVSNIISSNRGDFLAKIGQYATGAKLRSCGVAQLRNCPAHLLGLERNGPTTPVS
jgi:hypothetical protein